MPVECDIEVGRIGQEGFHAVDHEVMRHAFDIHNTLGRFCDERIYQEALAQRCRDSGLEAHREVALRVSHRDFTKSYYLDLLVQRSVIYELKTVDRLIKHHQAQLIHYLLLAGVLHGKLINLRPGSVESRFVSTRFNRKTQTTVHWLDDAWSGDDESCLLRECLSGLLADWGAFLSIGLYQEALLHFVGGPKYEGHHITIDVNGRTIGTQRMSLLNDDTAWHLSAVGTDRKT